MQNTLDLREWEAAIRPETRMIWVETPSNPTLALTDLAGVAAIGKRHGIRTVADNTFPSPIHTKPLAFGIDLSVASAPPSTWAGHSDVVAGVIAGRDADVVACWHLSKLMGPTLDPMARLASASGPEDLGPAHAPRLGQRPSPGRSGCCGSPTWRGWTTRA